MLGLPALQAVFTDIPRVTLEDMLARYRRWWQRKHSVDGNRLHWLVPGTVWAMDFTEPKFKVDARYPYLFTVRDLASHYHLCCQPVTSEKAEEVIPILQRLFIEHGPPLVMKSDNGSAFIAEVTQAFFQQRSVAVLYSPPRKPKYNGALERSNTTIKAYTAASANAAGHPLHWTSEDLRRALQIHNQLSRPWGSQGPNPEQSWTQRPKISSEQRDQLWAALMLQRMEAIRQLGFDQLQPAEVMAADKRQIDRLALSPVLQQLSYLKLTPVRRSPARPKRPKLNADELKAILEKQADPGKPDDSERPQPADIEPRPKRPKLNADELKAILEKQADPGKPDDGERPQPADIEPRPSSVTSSCPSGSIGEPGGKADSGKTAKPRERAQESLDASKTPDAVGVDSAGERTPLISSHPRNTLDEILRLTRSAAREQSSASAEEVSTLCPPARAARFPSRKLLALSPPIATMQEHQDASTPRAANSRATTFGRRVRALFSWLWRPITLLIRRRKAAKIP